MGPERSRRRRPGAPAYTAAMPGSTFGHLFRVTNFGESHGPAIGCVIDGCPPGLALSEIGMRGGQPSTTQPIAGPWLSPQVVTRNRWPKVLCDMLARCLAARF